MSETKLATKADLKEMYDRMLPYMGGMPEMLANKFSKGDLYSTDEKMIGQWIDGKPLYQKTINCGALPNNTAKNIPLGLDNIDIIYIVNAFTLGEGLSLNMPYAHKADIKNQIQIYLDIQNRNVVISTAVDMSDFIGYVTIQYTKTTDSAISIGSDTDYSTDEKIVGTWIDGKPVWQKTINFGALPNVDGKSVVIGSNLSIDKVISINGQAFSSVDGESLPISYAHPLNLTYAIMCRVQDLKTTSPCVYVYTKFDYSSYNAYVTIQYTKTTS